MRRASSSITVAVAVTASLAAFAGAQSSLCQTGARRFGGNLDDLTFGLHVDAVGTLVLSGGTNSFGVGADLLVLVHGAGGAFRAFSWDSGAEDEEQGSCLDPSGGTIYLSGERSVAGAAQDVLVARFALSGALDWAATWDTGREDHAGTPFLDSAGTLYLAGGTRGWATGPWFADDVLLMQLGPVNGAAPPTVARVVTWDGGYDDSINDGCVDGSTGTDFLYVAGNSWSPTVGRELLLQKYDTSLNLLWTQIWGGSREGDAETVAVDPAGNVYVGGTTSSPGGGDDDAVLLKWNPLGTLQWELVYGGPREENFSGILIAPGGTIHVTGQTQTAQAMNGLYVEVDVGGNLLREASWGGASNAVLGDMAFQGGALWIAGAAVGPVCNLGPAYPATATTRQNPPVRTVTAGATLRPPGTLNRVGGALRVLGAGTGGGLDSALLELRSCPSTYLSYGVGCPGSGGATPALSACAGSVPRVGTTFCAQLTGASAGASFPIMLVGRRSGPLDLTAIGMPGCRLHVALPPIDWPFTTASQWRIVIPADPCLLRVRFATQALLLDPGANPLGVVLSNAMEATIGP